jgi:hypothetical protein
MLVVALVAAPSIAAPGVGGWDSSIEEGLSRSPNHYIAGLIERVEFAGCHGTSRGEICAIRAKVIDAYAFKSPQSDKPPTSFLLAAARERGDKPVQPIRCLVFAVPMGDSGVYGATFMLCTPSESAVGSFKSTVRATIGESALEGE